MLLFAIAKYPLVGFKYEELSTLLSHHNFKLEDMGTPKVFDIDFWCKHYPCESKKYNMDKQIRLDLLNKTSIPMLVRYLGIDIISDKARSSANI